MSLYSAMGGALGVSRQDGTIEAASQSALFGIVVGLTGVLKLLAGLTALLLV